LIYGEFDEFFQGQSSKVNLRGVPADDTCGVKPQMRSRGPCVAIESFQQVGYSNGRRTAVRFCGSPADDENAVENGATMTASSDAFQSQLATVAADIESLIDSLLAAPAIEGEHARPRRLLDAMRYASLNGGKRFRPFLVAATAVLFDVPRQRALLVGAALECVHCYSLVHDDLPAMDNDDLRRGRPTAHKAFDEATAILAGDGLLTYAFDILARHDVHPDPAVRVELLLALARASGLGGMVGGQMLDLAAEGRFADGRPQALDKSAVTTLQAMKTGALLRFACGAGGILGQATAAERKALELYGSAVGQAFQIADDLLDLTGDSAVLGKATGKDAKAGKATLVGVLGVEQAKARLETLVTDAAAALAPFGAAAQVLIEAAKFVAERKA
jgi:farnesyl diphosphate synthase